MATSVTARRHRRSLVDISKPDPSIRKGIQEVEREPRSSVRISVNDGPKLGYLSIIVRVGDEPERTDFSVHEDLICSRSRFFANAMRHDWKESEDRIVPLPDDLPSTFAIYRTWLYSGLLASRGFSTTEEWGALCSAYILGEKLQDSEFKDTVIDAMIEKINEEPMFEFNPEMVVEIYENTPPQSHARRLLVDLYTFAGKSSWLSKEKREFLHEDFLYALLVQFMKSKEEPVGIIAPYHHQSTCAYHEHGGKPQGPCYKTKKFSWKSTGDESPRWTAVNLPHSDTDSDTF